MESLTVAQARVQYRQRAGQAFPEAGQQLGRQADFRNQCQRLSALCQHGFDQPQIDFGLAAAGHPFE